MRTTDAIADALPPICLRCGCVGEFPHKTCPDCEKEMARDLRASRVRGWREKRQPWMERGEVE